MEIDEASSLSTASAPASTTAVTSMITDDQKQHLELALGRAIVEWRVQNRRSGPARQNLLQMATSEYHRHIIAATTANLSGESSLSLTSSPSMEALHKDVDDALAQLALVSQTFVLLGDCTDIASLALQKSSDSSNSSSSDFVVEAASKEIERLVTIVGKTSSSSSSSSSSPPPSSPPPQLMAWVQRVTVQALSTDVPACEGVAYMLARLVLFRDTSITRKVSGGSILAGPVFHGVVAALALLPGHKSDPIIFARGTPPLLAVLSLAVRENSWGASDDGCGRGRGVLVAEWTAGIASLQRPFSHFRPAEVLLSRIAAKINAQRPQSWHHY